MINSNNYTPLYMQFHDLLLKDLINYPIGSNIPPERTLCEKHSLDRVTVRKALSILAKEGYIERKQGRGTTVLRHDRPQSGRVLFLLCQGAHMVDRLGEPFYARSLDALEERLQKTGMHLLYSKFLLGDNLVQLCQSLDAQAIILAGTPDSTMLEQCSSLRIPIIAYNTYIDDFPSIIVDNDGGAATSSKHLIALGHQQIGFIHVPGYINSDKRLTRFKLEIHNAGLSEQNLHIEEGDWSEESGYRAAQRLLSGTHPRVTAIFGGNDSMAIGALRAAQELGLRVPEDLSIIGFDGIVQSSLIHPALTTSKVDINSMAEAACMLLNHVMANGIRRGIHAMVSTEFLVRGSTAVPASKQ